MIYNYYDYKFINESFDINESFNINDIKEKIMKLKDKSKVINSLINKFNSIVNIKNRIKIGRIILLIYLMTLSNNSFEKVSASDIDRLSIEISNKDTLSKEVIEEELYKIMNINKQKNIIKIDTNIVNKINKIKPNILSHDEVDLYNKYDNDIINALHELEDNGEKPDYNLVKSIMVIETGMKPKKNHLNFHGFPQTKQKYINWINKKYHTNFTMDDMYDAYKSAQFIHYYIKSLFKSAHVNDNEDLIIAYNWGMGNLKDYKEGNKDLPKESQDYVDMFNVIKDNT